MNLTKEQQEVLSGAMIIVPLSQEEIGDATGLTKIHVNRTLKALREMGIMQISSKCLKVFDLDALRKLGNFDASSVYARSLY